MAKRAVGTRTTGTVATSKRGPRKTVRTTAKEEPTETPRERLLKSLNLEPSQYQNFDTLELLDLEYVLKDPEYSREQVLAGLLAPSAKNRETGLKTNEKSAPKNFPYEALLESRKEEHEFQKTHQAPPIEAGDCSVCGQKETVTFVAFNYHRADEAGTSVYQCTACHAKF